MTITRDQVSNEALREAFLRLEASGELTSKDVAQALNWYEHDGRPDSQRFRRTLGLVESSGGQTRKPYIRQSIHWDNVGPICRAMGLIPAELGY